MIFRRVVAQMHSTVQDKTTPYTLKDSVQSKIALKKLRHIQYSGKIAEIKSFVFIS